MVRMIEHQVELLRFIARRTCSNLEFMRHLRHCAGWQEIAQVQQSWFKQCVADYGEELGRLAGAGFQLARSDLTPLQWLMYRSTARLGAQGEEVIVYPSDNVYPGARVRIRQGF